MPRSFLGFAEDAYTDLDKSVTCLGLIVSEAGLVGPKVLHRAADVIVHLRIVLIEQRPEIVVAFVFETGNDARPIEAGTPVVPPLRVRQIELRTQYIVRDLHLGKVRPSQDGNGQTERQAPYHTRFHHG